MPSASTTGRLSGQLPARCRPSKRSSRGLQLIVLIYSLLSILTFVAYGFDKLAARRGSERISEPTLHLLALGGGWPGALAGQWLFRHKTRKPSFQACFWLTVLLNGALLLGWHVRL